MFLRIYFWTLLFFLLFLFFWNKLRTICVLFQLLFINWCFDWVSFLINPWWLLTARSYITFNSCSKLYLWMSFNIISYFFHFWNLLTFLKYLLFRLSQDIIHLLFITIILFLLGRAFKILILLHAIIIFLFLKVAHCMFHLNDFRIWRMLYYRKEATIMSLINLILIKIIVVRWCLMHGF